MWYNVHISPPVASAKGCEAVRKDGFCVYKGSDTNLALHLLSDRYKNVYDVAVIISNDSDLPLPIQFIRKELGKRIGLLNPQKHLSKVPLNCEEEFL